MATVEQVRQIVQKAEAFAQAIQAAEQAKQELIQLIGQTESEAAEHGKILATLRDACAHFEHLAGVAKTKTELSVASLATKLKEPTRKEAA